MKKKLFGKNIPPACLYCAYGNPAPNADQIFCVKRGAVNSYSSCRRFLYDPLKRTPQAAPSLPKHDPAEFEL